MPARASTPLQLQHSILGAIGAAAAAWVSLGTVGFQSGAGARLGLLPASIGVPLLVIGAAAGVFVLLRRGAPALPLSLLLLVFLPWLPIPVPAAFLIWGGPMSAVVWIGVGLMLWLRTPYQRRHITFILPGPVKAGICALLIFGAAAWRVGPTAMSGDAPHYLVITQSLLLDGDLEIGNNHRRRDYFSYYPSELAPHVQRLGRNDGMYSVHAPGLPAIVLPAFALAGSRGVVAFLLIVSAAGSALAWWIGWLTSRRADAAWLAWATVTVPVTAVFHSFSVYPDAAGGVLALTGLWALLRADEEQRTASERIAPWFWHGLALAILPWLQSRFAAIAGTLGALILLRLSSTRSPAAKAVAFLSIPALSAVLWLGFFIALYGRPDPSAPYPIGEMGSFQWIPGGLLGLLFDQRFGLLPYAPVLAFAFAGLAVMAARPATRRLAVELLFVMVPYLLTVTHFAMWWGGWSAPARFFAPVLPLLAAPAAILWLAVSESGRRERPLVLAALIFTMFTTAILVVVDGGRLAYNLRDNPSLWLEWLSGPSNLAQALPWWTRGSDWTLLRDVGIWIAACLGVVVIVRVAASRPAFRDRTTQHVVLSWALAVAVMAASTVAWAVRDADGRRVVPAQMQLLRTSAAAPRSVGVDLRRLQFFRAASLARRLRIEFHRPVSTGRSAARDSRPLFDVPRVPAGEYRLTPISDRPHGWVMVGVGPDQFALITTSLASHPQPILLRFPITVRNILIRGDEEARQRVSGVVLEPLGVMPAGEWGSDIGRRAVKYGHATVFFLDDRSFPEPEAFWAGGGRSSSYVIQSDDGRPVVAMLVRNGPVANHVTLEVSGAATELDFGPREERRVSIPVDASRGAARVTFKVTGGFHPSDHDPSSRDGRYLGAWVKVE